MKWLADYTGDIPGAKGYLRYDPDNGTAYWIRLTDLYFKFGSREYRYDWKAADHGYINDPTKFVLICPEEMMVGLK